jgi:hypothetical protein
MLAPGNPNRNYKKILCKYGKSRRPYTGAFLARVLAHHEKAAGTAW